MYDPLHLLRPLHFQAHKLKKKSSQLQNINFVSAGLMFGGIEPVSVTIGFSFSLSLVCVSD